MRTVGHTTGRMCIDRILALQHGAFRGSGSTTAFRTDRASRPSSPVIAAAPIRTGRTRRSTGTACTGCPGACDLCPTVEQYPRVRHYRLGPTCGRMAAARVTAEQRAALSLDPRWARQGSNLRPLGCKASRHHRPWPQPATTLTRSPSPALRNHPGRLHFVSHGVSRVQTIMHGCGHGRTRRYIDADLALASGTAASNTATTASDHVLGWPAQSPDWMRAGPSPSAGGPPPSGRGSRSLTISFSGGEYGCRTTGQLGPERSRR